MILPLVLNALSKATVDIGTARISLAILESVESNGRYRNRMKYYVIAHSAKANPLDTRKVCRKPTKQIKK